MALDSRKGLTQWTWKCKFGGSDSSVSRELALQAQGPVVDLQKSCVEKKFQCRDTLISYCWGGWEADLWDSLASHPSLPGKFQANQRPYINKKKISGQNLRNTQGCLLDSIVMSVNAQYMHTHKCKLGMSIKVATVIFLVALRRPVDPTPT